MEEAANPQDQVNAFWSMVAAGYEAHPGNVPAIGTDAYGRWVEMLDRKLSQEPSDVLDLATGTGFVALILARLGHRVTAMPSSPVSSPSPSMWSPAGTFCGPCVNQSAL
jgi:ubiquinone/menaquinone biosynthesis C-methylase UbiE